MKLEYRHKHDEEENLKKLLMIFYTEIHGDWKRCEKVKLLKGIAILQGKQHENVSSGTHSCTEVVKHFQQWAKRLKITRETKDGKFIHCTDRGGENNRRDARDRVIDKDGDPVRNNSIFHTLVEPPRKKESGDGGDVRQNVRESQNDTSDRVIDNEGY